MGIESITIKRTVRRNPTRTDILVTVKMKDIKQKPELLDAVSLLAEALHMIVDQSK